MNAVTMIDMGMQGADPVTPAKKQAKGEQPFDKVLEEKQQAQEPRSENQPTDRTAETAPRQTRQDNADKDDVAANSGPEQARQQEKTANRTKEQVRQGAEVTDSEKTAAEGEEALTAQQQVQQTLISLMKSLAGDDSLDTEESADKVEALLNDLVQQLEGTDLQGADVLAGIDLSGLAAELQALGEGPEQEQLLSKLAEQLQLQLNAAETADAVAMATEAGLQDNPLPVENLAAARDMLQKAIDATLGKSSEDGATVAEQGNAEAKQTAKAPQSVQQENAAEADPRFAGLLQPRENRGQVQAQPLKEQQQAQQGNQAVQGEATEGGQVQSETTGSMSETETAAAVVNAGKGQQVIEQMLQQAQRHIQASGQGVFQQVDGARTMPQNPVVQLSNGQVVPESQIFDQVVTHLSGSANGESGRMVLRLQPAELGSLKLDLVVEGDRIRANLHAQSQQVQEVLERNLPQLRNALAEQGLKIDQFQVNIDRGQDGGDYRNLAEQQQGSGGQQHWQNDAEAEEQQQIPLAHLLQNGGGGISLHV